MEMNKPRVSDERVQRWAEKYREMIESGDDTLADKKIFLLTQDLQDARERIQELEAENKRLKKNFQAFIEGDKKANEFIKVMGWTDDPR